MWRKINWFCARKAIFQPQHRYKLRWGNMTVYRLNKFISYKWNSDHFQTVNIVFRILDFFCFFETALFSTFLLFHDNLTIYIGKCDFKSVKLKVLIISESHNITLSEMIQEHYKTFQFININVTICKRFLWSVVFSTGKRLLWTNA